MAVFDEIFKNERKSDFTNHVARQIEMLNFGATNQIFDSMHAVLANRIIRKVQLSEA